MDGLWYIKDSQEEIDFKNAEEEKQMPLVKEEFKHLFFASAEPDSSPTHKKSASWTKFQSQIVGFYLSLKDGKSHLPLSKESIINNIRKQLKGSSKEDSSGSKDENIKGVKLKKSPKVEIKSDNEELSSDSDSNSSSDNFLRITFKSDFLYQIGKVAAKSGFMLEKALKFLNDFLLVINFFKEDMKSESYQHLRVNAIYYIGIAYFQLGDKETSEKFLREIQWEMIDLYGKNHKKVIKIDSILSTYFTERFNIAQCINDYF